MKYERIVEIKKLIKILAVSFTLIGFVACSHTPTPTPKESPSSASTSTTSTKPGIQVDQKALQTLEEMNLALEAYVLKSEKKRFLTLCQDKRFDCYVDGVRFPKKRKKILRKVPAYASGSKMGLQGEKRIQASYDFFP